MANTIGNKIYELRKNRNITQEALAKAVNVSTQAVSKWENGGSCDIELLPMIADYFNVSIDYLYGRSDIEMTNIAKILKEELLSLSRKEQMEKAMEYCLAMQKGITNLKMIDELLPKEKIKQLTNELDDSCFFIETDFGFSYMKLVKDQNYFILFPEPTKGYRSLIPDIETAQLLFKDLAKPHVLQVLYYLYERDSGFTLPLLCERCNLNETIAKEILNIFIERKWVYRKKVEMDHHIVETYFIEQKSSFILLLASLQRMLDEDIVAVGYNDREKPFL